MPTLDKKIDTYIEKSMPFAQPILTHLRSIVHKACPQAEEKMKWSFPHFDYKGQMLCSMAAFKQHCSFGFWKASLMEDYEHIFSIERNDGMGHLGKITSMKDLPAAKVLTAYIMQAIKLNDEGVKIKAKKTEPKPAFTVPAYFSKILIKNKAALNNFNAFSSSNKKEYIEWFEEAKTEPTRNRRIETAMEWIAEGKGRNWKYQKK